MNSNSQKPDNQDLYLSIVVPLFNEEDNVNILHKEIRDAADELKKPYEILFVDDGSTDRTLEILKDIKATEKLENHCRVQTRIVNFSRNFGQTAAMQAGFDLALGDIIIAMDGDLQNDPKDIPRFLKKLDEGYDVVCGWRKDRQDKKLTRILPSKVANWMIGKITGVPIHDNGCSLKAFRSAVIKSITLYSDMHRFIPALTTLAGARIGEIIVNHRARKFGQAKYGLSRVWKVLADIITIKMIVHFHDKPLLWFASFSFIFAAFGIGFCMLSILTYINGFNSIVYPATGFLFLSLAGSFLSWGLLAEFIISQEKK